jgi:hypothetical protein
MRGDDHTVWGPVSLLEIGAGPWPSRYPECVSQIERETNWNMKINLICYQPDMFVIFQLYFI